MTASVGIVLTIYNKQAIIADVISAILTLKSKTTTELIIVLDGCTDQSEEIARRLAPNAKFVVTPDVHELRANNAGLKVCQSDYACLIQDDMVLMEQNFDQALLQPFLRYDDLIAVTARAAMDLFNNGGDLSYINLVEESVGDRLGRALHLDRNMLYVRSVVNRGPLMLDLAKARSINPLIFDETLPGLCGSDDTDLCLKAYKLHGWRCGSYPVLYNSRFEWGSTRHPTTIRAANHTMRLNSMEVAKRHHEIFDILRSLPENRAVLRMPS